MSSNHRLRRTLPVFLLLAILLFASLPLQAAAVHRPLTVTWKVAAIGEDALSWLRNFFSGLGMRGIAKEGPTIDPDGKPHSSTPPDEGMTIDPNG